MKFLYLPLLPDLGNLGEPVLGVAETLEFRVRVEELRDRFGRQLGVAANADVDLRSML